jgi:hypothetical protein
MRVAHQRHRPPPTTRRRRMHRRGQRPRVVEELPHHPRAPTHAAGARRWQRGCDMDDPEQPPLSVAAPTGGRKRCDYPDATPLPPLAAAPAAIESGAPADASRHHRHPRPTFLADQSEPTQSRSPHAARPVAEEAEETPTRALRRQATATQAVAQPALRPSQPAGGSKGWRCDPVAATQQEHRLAARPALAGFDRYRDRRASEPELLAQAPLHETDVRRFQRPSREQHELRWGDGRLGAE